MDTKKDLQLPAYGNWPGGKDGPSMYRKCCQLRQQERKREILNEILCVMLMVIIGAGTMFFYLFADDGIAPRAMEEERIEQEWNEKCR